MSKRDPISTGRYRRRIIGLGALAFVVAFVIGALIFVPVVQNDLEDRVVEELGDAGIDGVSASFSGQDGTLTCDVTLDDPSVTEALAEDVHGVRVIDLDQSCLADTSTAVDEPPATDEPPTEPAVTAAPASESATTVATTVAPSTTEPVPQLDSIVDIIDQDPLFSQLSSFLATAGIDGEDDLGGDGPFTLLAPTDDAFNAARLDADEFAALAADPVSLRTLLLHHATEGVIESGDFVVGDLEMLDGSAITVDPGAADGITFTSNDVSARVDDPATQLDIEASNGVIHAIDQLLLPESLGLGEAPSGVTTTASFAEGQVTLSGVVQTEQQRNALVAAASAEVDPANVIDELAVDPAAVLDDADLDRLAGLVGSMPSNLVDGEASLVDTDLTLTGTYLNDEAQSTLDDVGDTLGATLDLSARAAADADSAAALQAELNEFVQANPILFEPNSAVLTVEATAIIEQLASRAASLDGTTITIVGHTDSDGDPAFNQVLSEQRAASVLDALAARGIDPATLASDGRGSTEPINDATGVEDKAASRRVEFIVEAT